MSQPLHTFYWADRPSPKTGQLLASAAAQGLNPQPIGLGARPSRFHFSLFKQQALFNAVRHLPDTDLVCATDGFDVFYQQGADDIRSGFAGFDADVVFSAERGYSHQYARCKPFFDQLGESAGSPYRYLNAGGVVGYAGALRELYRPRPLLKLKIALFRQSIPGTLADGLYRLASRTSRASSPEPGDEVHCIGPHRYTDQAEMARCMSEGRYGLRYALDSHCVLFWCTAFEWDTLDAHYELAARSIVNRHTQSVPAMIHVPWGKKRAEFLRLYDTFCSLRGEPAAEPVGGCS